MTEIQMLCLCVELVLYGCYYGLIPLLEMSAWCTLHHSGPTLENYASAINVHTRPSWLRNYKDCFCCGFPKYIGLPIFYVLLTVHLDILCNENQLDALFIVNLFRQSSSICFGHVYCPSSGGMHCIVRMYSNYYVLYNEYPLMMGNKNARNM
jgi:hypothetical protein